MPGKEHLEITQAAAGSLPAWQKKMLGEDERNSLIRASSLPDKYFDLKGGGYREALPYMLFIDGIQFHYLPNSPIEPEYKYWSVVCDKKGSPRRLKKTVRAENLNWKHAFPGFSYYFEKMSRAVKAHDFKAFGGFGGVFLHVIQDACTGLHSLEGVDGVDIFALDRLIKPPDQRPDFFASSALCSVKYGKVESRNPVLLGETPQEAAFNLYSLYHEKISGARYSLIPLVSAIYNGEGEKAEDIYTRSLSESAGLCADILYTVFCIGGKKFLKKDLGKLKKIYLSDVKPVREPRGLSFPYRFLTMLKDCCLGTDGKRVLLQLRDEQGRTRVFRKGMGTGCHFEYNLSYFIPPAVFKKFSCFAGLHAELGRGGDFSLRIKLKNRNVYSARFNDGQPSAKIEFPVNKGGLLEFIVTSDRGMDAKENNIVWGSPVLLKD